MKRVATYEPDAQRDYIQLNRRAEVFCKTHSRPELCNRPVFTSPVLVVRGDGSFETQNTIYIPTEEA